MVGQIVKVIVDRPLGSVHPKHPDIHYFVNYGYLPGLLALDGEALDAYIVGVDVPVKEFMGKITAILHREDDAEDKLVVASEESCFTADEIYERVSFQECFFKTSVQMTPDAKPRIKGDTQ